MPYCSVGSIELIPLRSLSSNRAIFVLLPFISSVTTRLYPNFENTFLVVISFNFEAKVSAQEYLRI